MSSTWRQSRRELCGWRERRGERFGGNFATLPIQHTPPRTSSSSNSNSNSNRPRSRILLCRYYCIVVSIVSSPPTSTESLSNNGAVLLSLQALPSFFERRIRLNCERNHQRAIGRRRFRTSSSLDRCLHVSAIDNDFGRSQ